jgi:hypothetical protein
MSLCAEPGGAGPAASPYWAPSRLGRGGRFCPGSATFHSPKRDRPSAARQSATDSTFSLTQLWRSQVLSRSPLGRDSGARRSPPTPGANLAPHERRFRCSGRTCGRADHFTRSGEPEVPREGICTRRRRPIMRDVRPFPLAKEQTIAALRLLHSLECPHSACPRVVRGRRLEVGPPGSLMMSACGSVL